MENSEKDTLPASGAGVLPFAIHSGEVYFLFHKTFVGKKVGKLIDFGGGMRCCTSVEFSSLIHSKADEKDMRKAAAREFSEETAGLFLCKESELKEASTFVNESSSEKALQRNPFVITAAQKVLQMIIDGEKANRVWHLKNRTYHLFVFQLEYLDTDFINKVFESAPKRREFVWISAMDVINQSTAIPLFARVSKIPNIIQTVSNIRKQVLQLNS